MARWSSDTATAAQRLTGLPTFGAGDVLMFVLDPAAASLWIGKNGVWRDDPVTGAATWTAGGSPAFHPVIQGRNPGDGGTLRSLSSQLSYPVPPGAQPLGFREPDLRIFQTHAWLEIGGERRFAPVDVFFDRGFAFHLDHILGELQQLLQEIDAQQQPLLMPVLQVFEPFGQRLVLRITSMLSKATGQFDRDFLRFLLGVGIAENRLEKFCVHHQCVEIVAHCIDMHVLVDQFDGFCAKAVPEQSTGSG